MNAHNFVCIKTYRIYSIALDIFAIKWNLCNEFSFTFRAIPVLKNVSNEWRLCSLDEICLKLIIIVTRKLNILCFFYKFTIASCHWCFIREYAIHSLFNRSSTTRCATLNAGQGLPICPNWTWFSIAGFISSSCCNCKMVATNTSGRWNVLKKKINKYFHAALLLCTEYKLQIILQ